MGKQEKYLYGASVQGIQSFIFQTNKLREIVGASELVEEVCTTKFKEIVPNYAYENDILHAAGNIKYIFEKKDDCKKVVLNFPKIISHFAPGITVSQAVVKMEGELADFSKAVNELENRLHAQRNKRMRSETLGLMGISRSRQTGLPVVAKSDDKGTNEHLDAGSWAKLYEFDKKENRIRKKTTLKLSKKAFGDKELKADRVVFDIDDMTEKNDWIAVIHADGNGLGQIVQQVGVDQHKFKEFSENLDKATTAAAIAAYEHVVNEFDLNKKKRIPIRPIVLGGDDFTVICRADLALEYTTKFIEEFENQTHNEVGEILTNFNVFTEGNVKDRLTACAGIAYIKSSFPFYYGYELAEALCTRAKKDAKDKVTIKKGEELPASCLMFHKVQDSFTEDYNDIAKRELQPQANISFEFGPYYLKDKDNRWTIENLTEKVKNLQGKEGNTVKSHLRNWMSLIHNNYDMSTQKLERLKSITTMKVFVDSVTKETSRTIIKDGKKELITTYPVYDILAIHTINNQQTKEDTL